jgi:predicted RNA-binding protein Jag
MIDETIKNMNSIVEKMSEDGELSERALAIAVECNQRYIEYLDDLLDTIHVNSNVTVYVDGKKIKFQNADSMAAWIAEVMK